MRFSEDVSLAELTTFKLGGKTRGIAACFSVEDVQAAFALSRERGLPWYVIGGGSNLLANDAGYEGIMIHIGSDAMTFEDSAKDSSDVQYVLAIAEAGAVWNTFVQESVARGLWGIENLAGIPGSVGGAPVQNIGAYGADISQTLAWVEAFDTKTETLKRFTNEECMFGYRDSRFKHDPSLIIMRVAFNLARNGSPQIEYTDLRKKAEAGEALSTPSDIAKAVRGIRAGKFPDLAVSGTAGSFFKNPTVTQEAFDALRANYPELPGYPAEGGIKLSLAWVLDHALALKGYSKGSVRLFEKQPLVIVAESGATAHDVDALALEIEQLVFNSTGIHIEREVRTLG